MISAFNTALKSFVAASSEIFNFCKNLLCMHQHDVPERHYLPVTQQIQIQVVYLQEGWDVYEQLNNRLLTCTTHWHYNPASICHTICQKLTGRIWFRCLTFDMISCIWQGYFVSA